MAKSLNDVLKAIDNNEPLTNIELRCAVTLLNIRYTKFLSLTATVLKEATEKEEISKRTFDNMQRLYTENDFDKDLEKYILGSSHDPTLSKEERKKLFFNKTAETGAKLFNALNKMRQR